MDNLLVEAKLETERLRQEILFQELRPSFMYRAFVYCEGDQWVCVGGLEEEKIAKDIFGVECNSRVYGYGNSPEEALRDFDRAWETGEFEVKI